MSWDVYYVLSQMALAYIAVKVTWFLFYRLILLGVFRWGHLDVGRLFKGGWVVITGATDGIGKAFAMKLARQGLNIMLVSRSPEKLVEVSKMIEETYNVMTRIVVIDFTTDPEEYEVIMRDAVDSLSSRVMLLVNNVGMGYDYPEFYADLEDGLELVHKITKCNIASINVITHVVLKAMLLNERQSCGTRGAIINIGSFSSCTPAPLLTVYAATKAYVNHFSISLHGEYNNEGIVVQCLTPSLIVSKFSKIKHSSLLVPSASDFVDSALSTLGVHSQTTGYWSHTVLHFLMNLLPISLQSILFFSNMNKIRCRALAKKVAVNKTF